MNRVVLWYCSIILSYSQVTTIAEDREVRYLWGLGFKNASHVLWSSWKILCQFTIKVVLIVKLDGGFMMSTDIIYDSRLDIHFKKN